jgi:hypothetical protein
VATTSASSATIVIHWRSFIGPQRKREVQCISW